MSDGKWHGGKGSKRRPEDFNRLSNEWDRIFNGLKKTDFPDVKARKAQPQHSITQIHKDRTKQIPRHYKYKNIEE